MVSRMLRGFLLGLGIVNLSFAAESVKQPWPFDQRQILLVQGERSQFPDDLALTQLMDAFVNNGRVRWVTKSSGPGQVNPVIVPSDFAWTSSSAVRQLGLKFKVDGIVELSMVGVQLNLRWFSTLDGLPLFIDAISLPQAGAKKGEAEERKQRIVNWVGEIWSRIPGQGYVTKRDLSSLTLEAPLKANLRPGTKIELVRLQEIERHPLLKTIVKIKSSLSGRGEVTKSTNDVTNANILYESALDPIQIGDRFKLAVQNEEVATPLSPLVPTPLPTPVVPAESQAPSDTNYLALVENNELASRFLDLSVLGLIGSASYQERVVSGVYNLQTFSQGAEVAGRVYITREWIAESALNFNMFNFGTVPGDYGTTQIKSGSNSFRFTGGYRLLFLEDDAIPGEASFHLGYRRHSLRLKGSEAFVAPQSKVASGFELGAQVVFPIMEKVAATMSIYRMFAVALRETPRSTGAKVNNAIWQFDVGGKYRLSVLNDIFAGIRVNSFFYDFEGQGLRSISASEASFKQTQAYVGYLQRF